MLCGCRVSITAVVQRLWWQCGYDDPRLQTALRASELCWVIKADWNMFVLDWHQTAEQQCMLGNDGLLSSGWKTLMCHCCCFSKPPEKCESTTALQSELFLVFLAWSQQIGGGASAVHTGEVKDFQHFIMTNGVFLLDGSSVMMCVFF